MPSPLPAAAAEPPAAGSARLTAGWIALLCAAAAGLAYAFAIHGTPLFFDDVTAISDNGVVVGRLPWWAAFTRDFWGGTGAAQTVRPVVTLSFRLEWMLSGGSPLVLRATNVLLHVSVCALAGRLFAERLPAKVALAAGLLFAVLAAPSEAVEAVVGRADLLLLLFGLLGFAAHASGQRLLSAAFLLLALGCKESAIFLPVAWYVLGPPERRTMPSAALFLAPLALAAADRFVVFGGLHVPQVPLLANSFRGAPLPARLLGAGRIFARFTAAGLVDPARRLYLCSTPACGPAAPTEPLAWLGLSLLVGVPLAALALRRRAPHAAAGLFLFALFWLPVSNLVVPSSSVYGERLLYAPALGLCLAAASLLESRAGPAAAPLLAAFALWNAVALQFRHRDWRDREHLYLSALPIAPDAAQVQQNAALAFFLRHDAAAAAEHASLALRLWPDFPEAQATLALSLEKLGRAAEADRLFRTALDRSNFSIDIAADYARFLLRAGRRDEATALLRRAQSLHPNRTLPPSLWHAPPR